jgi:hypothetical protein
MGDLRDQVAAFKCDSWAALSSQMTALSYSHQNSGGDHWIYRGQADANWWLKPSIELFRDSLKVPVCQYSVIDLEKQFLYQFQSIASQFLENLPGLDEHLEWLAVLQHYGTPTRLLDWTYSPTVAAYFALREVPHSSAVTKACIWALNLGKLKTLVMESTGYRDWQDAYVSALEQIKTIKPRSLSLRSNLEIATQECRDSKVCS